MSIVRDVGAIAGLAAFLGVGLLALLFFIQARDVRRLREWAGGAPERDAAVVEATSEVAAERSAELERLEQERKRKQGLRDAEVRAANLRETRRQRREAGLPEQTRWEIVREKIGGGPAGGSSIARYALAILVVVAVAVAGVLFIPGLIGGSDNNTSGNGGGGALKPGRIEVAVLNGTAVPDLASRFSDKIERKGFQIGVVTNSDTSFATSVVMFKPGFKPEARKVANDLKIPKIKPIAGGIKATAAGADVAVVIGDNDASGPPG